MSAPFVAVSPDGKKTALAWMDRRARDMNVFWTLATGLSITSDAMLNDAPNGDQNHPQIAFDKAGVAWIVWEDDRSGTKVVYGANSAKPKNVKLSGGEGTYPSVACGGGVVAVVYEAGGGVEFASFPE